MGEPVGVVLAALAGGGVVIPRLAITTSVLEPQSELLLKCFHSQCVTTTREPFRSDGHEWLTRHNTPEDNLGVTGSLQWLYEHTTAPIIAFIHSDVEIYEQGWDERVLKEFDDPSVGVVGFGGATQLGADDIYRTPYRLMQLRRINYMSNQTDAEAHGRSFTGECDVATCDGFALVVRRMLLDRWGGWPVKRYPFHNYDNALCIESHRQGYRVRLVGIACTHHGGRTSTTPEVQAYWQSLGTSDQQIHTESHLRLYEDGRGILPLRVANGVLR